MGDHASGKGLQRAALARRTGCNLETIRYYEKIGMLPDPPRTAAGYRVYCIFPGGFGTLDEMFESLTLIQTKRMKPVPFLLFGRDFWERLINWQMLADAGTISAEDLKLFQFVETAEEAVAAIDAFETPCP